MLPFLLFLLFSALSVTAQAPEVPVEGQQEAVVGPGVPDGGGVQVADETITLPESLYTQENAPYEFGVVLIQYTDTAFTARATETEDSDDDQDLVQLLDDDTPFSNMCGTNFM